MRVLLTIEHHPSLSIHPSVANGEEKTGDAIITHVTTRFGDLCFELRLSVTPTLRVRHVPLPVYQDRRAELGPTYTPTQQQQQQQQQIHSLDGLDTTRPLVLTHSWTEPKPKVAQNNTTPA